MATLTEKLKEILGDLFTSEVEAKLGEFGKHTAYLWNKDDEKQKDKEPIPKHRVNEMIETSKAKAEALEGQITTFENQAKDYDKQLKELKKAAEGNGDLVKQIETLQKSNKDQKDSFDLEKEALAKKEVALKKAFTLKEHLLDAGVGDVTARELLSKNFDIDKIEVGDDGKIKGFDDLLKPIKENKAFEGFFGTVESKGQFHKQGEDNLDGEFYTREQLKSMTPEQVADNIEKVDKSMAALK